MGQQKAATDKVIEDSMDEEMEQACAAQKAILEGIRDEDEYGSSPHKRLKLLSEMGKYASKLVESCKKTNANTPKEKKAD